MSFDLAAADAAYRPFAPFASWAKVDLDLERWREHEAALEELRRSGGEAQRRALEVVLRTAAVQTGAIEGLYEADRGFTFTLAAQSALMQLALSERTPRERAHLADQFRAYEHVVDFATQRVPIAEAWIRELHAELCRSQKTYEVQTGHGPQLHLLPIGTYKSMPNHVLQRDGSIHSYAPVLETPSEMARLVTELSGEAFAAAHPILQAAFAHYALVAVHPFVDGNGRVARALGSVFTCRSYSLPLLIYGESRARYFAALEAADQGDPAPFARFVLDRCIEATGLARATFEIAQGPSPEEVSEGIAALYRSRGGFTSEDIDQAAANLERAFVRAWTELASTLTERRITIEVSVDNAHFPVVRPGSRRPNPADPRRVVVKLSTHAPAQACVLRAFGTEFDDAVGPHGELVMSDTQSGQVFAARVEDVLPRIGSHRRLLLDLAVERCASRALAELKQLAEKAARADGH